MDVRMTAKGLMADRRSEAAMTATEIGRRSHALRGRAHKLREMGRLTEAFRLYEAAAACFDEHDTSDAAAAAFHDLGEALLWTDRYWTHTLPRAEALFRRALESPGRRADPRRVAMSRSGLSKCLRRMAEHAPDGASRADLLRRAVTEADEAAALVPLRGDATSLDVRGGALIAAGNALVASGREGEAIKRFREATDITIRTASAPELSSRDTLAQVLLNLLSSLRRRGRKGDIKEARQLHERVRELLLDSRLRGAALLEMAAFALVDGRDRKVSEREARKYLGEVHPSGIDPGSAGELVRIAREARCPDLARKAIYRWFNEAIGHRSGLIDDNDADYAADRVQLVAWELAGLELAEGNVVAAFLAVENVSGLRWVDALTYQARACVNDIDPVLIERLERTLRMLELNQAGLSALSLGLEGAPAAIMCDIIEECGAHTEPEVISEVTALWERLPENRDEALVRVQAVVDEQERTLRGIDARMTATSPTWRRVCELAEPIAEARLRRLVEAHPDTVFVRIGVREKLRAIGVWWDGGRVAASQVERELPEAFMAAVGQGQDADMLDALMSLDLSAAFGPAGMHRLVLLPNSVAARFPLDVVGPPGSSAIDQFDAVVWMPSLVGLEMPWADASQRRGTVALAPPGTRFGSAALGDQPGITCIAGESATSAAYRKAIAEARVVALYTHGRHQDGEDFGSTLAFADGPMRVPGPGIRPRGLQRIELWACESGVDSAPPWFGPTADEPYGMDGIFLVAGARSSIGTLWPVRDIVTAILIMKYRRLLSDGMRADEALHRAKRWWRDQGAARAVDNVRDDQALTRERIESLLSPPSGTLGPAPAVDGESGGAAREKLLRDLLHPRVWSGYRFQGDWRTKDHESRD